jgi:hypothetical protein
VTGVVVRRTQVPYDKLSDFAVNYKKAYISYQSGSVKIRAYTSPGSYTAFSPAFGTTPLLSFDLQYSGISYYRRDRVRPGSFSVIGSPIAKYLRWEALGFR